MCLSSEESSGQIDIDINIIVNMAGIGNHFSRLFSMKANPIGIGIPSQNAYY
jgi:hypothetical protein